MSEFNDILNRDDLPDLFPADTYSIGVPWWDDVSALSTTPVQLDPVCLDDIVDGLVPEGDYLPDDLLMGIEEELDELDHVETDPDTDAEMDDLSPSQRARQLAKLQARLHELRVETCRIRDEQDRLTWRVKYLQDN